MKPLDADELREVATREGGVDRNQHLAGLAVSLVLSPPARVAWIEISLNHTSKSSSLVATREGGVDRNPD